MDFFTKTVVMRQTESGFSLPNKPITCICRLEYDGGIFKTYLSLNNFLKINSGEFFFCLLDGTSNLYTFRLDTLSPSATIVFPSKPDIKSFAVGIYYLENNIPLLIAYGKSNGGTDLAVLKKTLYDKHIKSPINVELFETTDTQQNQIPNVNLSDIYDDEAVATENYYEDEELKKQLEFIESFENDDFGNGNEQDAYKKQESAQETEKNFDSDGDEKNFEDVKNYSKENPYFLTVKDEITDILSKFPDEGILKNVIPNSRFVKINYAENKYYTVGIIMENGKERYICYGVPDKYSKNPPKELKGYCQFVPLSMFNVQGDGYWMMFQDAITGACVKMK